MTTTSTYRIPPLEPTGPLGAAIRWYSTRKTGAVLDGTRVLWHHRRILMDVARFSGATERWATAPPMLRTLALMGSASTIGCEWCLDLGYFMGSRDGLDEATLREVPRWKESDAFGSVERRVLAYAEAMSSTPVGVTDAMADFARHRDLLFAVVYEMLGQAADTEDVLQETWLRWAEVDHARVEDPRAYLVRIATRLALNQMRTLARRRESYVGPWLPAPVLTTPDVADDVVLAETVSTAMLLVLQTLGPTERAVFVLREVFGFDHASIAEAVDRSEEAVRQIAHRARRHVAARRPRMETDRAERDAVVERFLRAARGGAVQDLMGVLAPDVVLLTDGGGRQKAALRPIHGVEKVLRFIDGVRQPGWTFDPVPSNDHLTLVVRAGGQVAATIALAVRDGRVAELYVVNNPEKLGALEAPQNLTRS